MKSATFVLVSLAVGSPFAALMIALSRRRGPTDGRRLVLVIVSLLLGFTLTSAFGNLLLGDAAMPAWSHAMTSLWVVAMGIIYAFDLHALGEEKSHILRPLGFFMIAAGLFATAAYLF